MAEKPKRGRPAKPETTTLSLRVPVWLAQALREAAVAEGWGGTGRIVTRAVCKELGVTPPPE